MGKIRVLLAEDHETIQARVRSTLCEDFEVVGTVGNTIAARSGSTS
jgi:hypothetical protein